VHGDEQKRTNAFGVGCKEVYTIFRRKITLSDMTRSNE